jgi:hypothetical protein
MESWHGPCYIRGDMSYAIFSHHYVTTSRRRTTYATLIFVRANWLLSKSLESITNLMSSIMKQNFDTDAYLCIFPLGLQNSSSVQNVLRSRRERHAQTHFAIQSHILLQFIITETFHDCFTYFTWLIWAAV